MKRAHGFVLQYSTYQKVIVSHEARTLPPETLANIHNKYILHFLPSSLLKEHGVINVLGKAVEPMYVKR